MSRIRPPRTALTAAQVADLVAESQADVDECLISPLWGAQNPGGTIRHLNRFVRVMGLATRGAAYGKIFLSSIGTIVGLAVLMAFNSNFGLVGDIVWSVLLGIPISYLATGYFAFRSAFAPIRVHEHRDFTDRSQITAKVSAWTSRLSHFYSHAWRGDNEANGIANAASKLYYKTDDRPVWLEEGETITKPDGTVIEGPQLVVYPARKISNFLEMKDYLNLDPERFEVGGNSARDRRAARRVYAKPGQGLEEFERGKSTFFKDNFIWFYSIGSMASGVLIVIFALG